MTRKQVGFTLIELITVVAIIGILAAIAIPSFTDWMKRSRTKGAADMIVSTLNYAKSESIKQNKDTCLKIFNANSTDWKIMISSSCAESEADLDSSDIDIQKKIFKTIKATEFQSNIKLALAADSKLDETRFTPRTQKPTFKDNQKTNQQIYLSIDNYKLTISITPTGLISTCSSGSNQMAGYAKC